MTAEPASIVAGDARDGRDGPDGPLERLLLLVPPAIVLIVAAITPTASLYPDQSDVNLYLGNAQKVVAGQLPYRDFKFEYPPGGLIPMVVPYLAGVSPNLTLDAYKVLFAGWQAFLLLILGLVVGRLGEQLGQGRGPALRLIALTVAAALSITWRYDLFPAVLSLVAVGAALERRLLLVGVAIGVGVLAKLYPAVLLPALALPWLMPFDLPRLVRLGATVGLTVLVGLLPFVALAGDDAFGFLTYYTGRGLQIESVGGALAMLQGLLTGTRPDLSFGFGAVQVEGPLPALLLGLLPVLAVILFGALAVLGWRRVRSEQAADPEGEVIRPATLVALAFASVLVLLVTSKVYSIQYVVWIIPFIALLRGRQFWLALVVVALTMPIHPILYRDLVLQHALPILVLNLRNALAVALTVWVLADLARTRQRTHGASASEGNGAPGETRTHDL